MKTRKITKTPKPTTVTVSFAPEVAKRFDSIVRDIARDCQCNTALARSLLLWVAFRLWRGNR